MYYYVVPRPTLPNINVIKVRNYFSQDHHQREREREKGGVNKAYLRHTLRWCVRWKDKPVAGRRGSGYFADIGH